MAEEKKTGWFGKLIGWFASLPGRIAKAFKNMVAELRKVTWPSKNKLISSCIAVLVLMLVVGAVVSLLDVGSAALVNGIYTIGHPDSQGDNTNTGVTPTNIEVADGTAGEPVVEGTEGAEAGAEGAEAGAEGAEAGAEGAEETQNDAEGTQTVTEGAEAETEGTETAGNDEGAAETAE